MFLILIVVLVTSPSNGLPVTDDVQESLFDETEVMSLGSDVKFGWSMDNEDSIIEMNIGLPFTFTWLTVGFHNFDFTGEKAEDLVLIYVKNKGTDYERIKVTTIHFTSKGVIAASEENLYFVVKKLETSDGYEIKLRRELNSLPLKKAIKLLWGYGVERSYKAIKRVFNERLKKAFVTLNSPNVMLDIAGIMKGTAMNNTQEPPPNNNETPQSIPNNETPQPVPNNNETPSESENADGIVNTKFPDSESENGNENLDVNVDIETTMKTSVSLDIKTKTKTTVSAIKTTELIHKPTDAVSVDEYFKSEPNIDDTDKHTTPCPTPKCNCSQDKPVHWWEDLSNSVYMAIIGASALLTGLLVLFIACCCAGKRKKIPRTRKHKVAFYKVDDFDSNEDDEIEFLKDDKGDKGSD